MNDFLFDFYFFKTLINTNDEVKKNKNLKKKNNIALFFFKQTKGRGRIKKMDKQKRRFNLFLFYS